MKTVLLLAYHFPPTGGGGTQRPAKFAKYLDAFGWRAHVVTTTCNTTCPPDMTLLEDMPDSVRVDRVAEDETGPHDWARRTPAIDIARHWLEPAYNVANEICRTQHVDAVMATMSPFDLCYPALRLGAQHDLPVILDLRDPWAVDGWRVHPTRQRWLVDFEAMITAVHDATLTIANTPAARDAIIAATGISSERVSVIPNGYDAYDFSSPSQSTRQSDDTFRLVHTGTLHTRWLSKYRGPLGWLRRARHYRPEPIDIIGRTEVPLVNALAQLQARDHPLMKQLQVYFVGKRPPRAEQYPRPRRVTECLQYTGYVSHHDSISYVRDADALFLPLHGLPNACRSLIVPGKTYEYLASGRPILGALPRGDARDLVADSERGYLAQPTNAIAIATALETLYSDWRRGELAARSPRPWVRRYERKALTGRLASDLDRLVIGRPVSHGVGDAAEPLIAQGGRP